MNFQTNSSVFTKSNCVIRQAFLRQYADLPNNVSQALKSLSSLTILSVECGDKLRDAAKSLNATKITVTTTGAVAFLDDEMKVLGHITPRNLVADYFPIFKKDVIEIMKLNVHDLRQLSSTPVEIPEMSLLGFAFYRLSPSNEYALTALSLGKAQSLRNTVQSINFEKSKYDNPSFGVRSSTTTDDNGLVIQKVFIDGEMVKHTMHLKSEDEVVRSNTCEMPSLDDLSDSLGEIMIKPQNNQSQNQKTQQKSQIKKTDSHQSSTTVLTTPIPSNPDVTFEQEDLTSA